MASKDKTSKTARVMNLLSKKPDPSADEPAAAPVPPIVTAMAPDVAVSAQIKNALENVLESELGPQSPAPQPAPVQQAAPAPQPEPVQPAPPQPEPQPVQQAAPAPQPEPVQPAPPQPEPQPVQQAAPAPQPEPVQPEPQPAVQADAPTQWMDPLPPVNPGYINVMQVLVEEKAPKYVKMFGLCSCERCMEDVKAYTLNHLPPKYVVLEQGDLIPRLTVYEGKFSSDITAQLLQACKVVMERPHHGR